VQIIEARKRVGGRVYTEMFGETPIDLGASWIHQPINNPLTAIAQKLQLKFFTTNGYTKGVTWMYDANGNTIPESAFQKVSKYVEESLEKRAEQFLSKQKKDVSFAHLIDSVVDMKKMNEQEKHILQSIKNSSQMEFATDLEKLSARQIILDEGGEFTGGDSYNLSGNKRIIDHLLNDISVSLGERVRRIAQSSSGVTVTTDKQSYEADFAIVTVPLSLLKQNVIEFSPKLPDTKVQAINRLGMGMFNKIVMEFHNVFWNTDKPYMAAVDGSKDFFGIINYHKMSGGKPFLIATATRDFAIQLESQNIESIKRYWQEYFHKKFKHTDIDFKNIHVTNWYNDEYSRGSYSFVPVGASGKDMDILAEPVGNICFAGEATHSRHYTSMHGAHLSGIREAERILKA
jgi:monoamine oxidase